MVPSGIKSKNMKHVILLAAAVLTFGTSVALAANANANEENGFFPVVMALVMIAGGIAARIIEKRKSAKAH